ncbi:FAD/NAD-P-binding domain-containing protein [Trametes polyzona]|nr:FAD/NAD-P-binding domain-containing protein [Trametes polyzona]
MSEYRKPDLTRSEPVVVIGAGVAGLITAHTLIRDGFTDVQVLTREARVGGVWARDRIYPGLHLNNVHGTYRLSPLEMPPTKAPGGRITGDDMADYTEAFAAKFLQGKVQFEIEVRSVRRPQSGTGWMLDVCDLQTGAQEMRACARLVVCTGGCNTPLMPEALSPDAATAAGFKGMVFHSGEFNRHIDALLVHTAPKEKQDGQERAVVVVGGGKSSQDIAAYLANKGRKVILVCHNLDSFSAGTKTAPDWKRKSRLTSLFSPHVHLRTPLERFLHTTWLGKKIVDAWWRDRAESSFRAAGIREGSPLRNTVSPFWHTRVNDEGVPRADGFHALALAGRIQVLTPAHASGYGEDGHSVVLADGTSLPASAVILGTGYASSWNGIFSAVHETASAETMEALGLNPHPANPSTSHRWDYTTLANSPPLHPATRRWSLSLVRGLVPARNIARRDFAVNGDCVSTNNGYTYEVSAHWISSYFLGDDMRIPQTPGAAFAEAERQASWLKWRHPQIPSALYPSHTAQLAFWTWPQHVDDLLEDMGLPVMRSGGNALTWPFKVVDIDEIKYLTEERAARRAKTRRA